KLLKFSDLTKFLVLNFHAKHQIFNGLNTWLLGAVNKLTKNNRSIASIKPWNSHSITTFPNDLNLIKQWMKSLIDPDKNENDTSDKTKQ
ncbi:hypothetical protein EEK90_13145, partial [Muribaculaceae bacterium Isolate-036 (Harlan)]